MPTRQQENTQNDLDTQNVSAQNYSALHGPTIQIGLVAVSTDVLISTNDKKIDNDDDDEQACGNNNVASNTDTAVTDNTNVENTQRHADDVGDKEMIISDSGQSLLNPASTMG
jgi:hypothetical protein